LDWSSTARPGSSAAVIDTTGNYTAALVATAACFTAAGAIFLSSRK